VVARLLHRADKRASKVIRRNQSAARKRANAFDAPSSNTLWSAKQQHDPRTERTGLERTHRSEKRKPLGVGTGQTGPEKLQL